ncbi:MBG domain-containing protein [Ferruginibacter paludis]|uniref:MBG domain-containing protein n=1 Tax=Ferruginibacter paludis TaxID=1310417 RepID=UPI0025B45CDA|nr:MBG domain-containing protein [Ferruginibacter paludis]MDN3654626.1 MBG domain-containing protein [Ferruginibacter paludis]
MRQFITCSTLAKSAFTFVLFLSLLSTLQAQQTSISDYVIFGGTSQPLQGQKAPAAPGYGVQLGSSTTINGGSIGSYKFVQTTGNSSIGANIFSGGTISLTNSNVVTGKIAAGLPNTNPAPGTVLSIGSSATLGGSINVNGNIVIGGGTVTGPVNHPLNTTYYFANNLVPNVANPLVTLPVLPSMPAINQFPVNNSTVDITTTTKLIANSNGDPVIRRNILLGGNKTITLQGAGIYVFKSIKNTGNSNSFVFDLSATPLGKIKVYVEGDVDLGKVTASVIGGNESSIYFETHGTGTTSPSGTVAWNTANGSGGGSKWVGSVWAPYAAINIGSGTGSTTMTGALWSGTQVILQSGITINFAPFIFCDITGATTQTNVLCKGSATGSINLTVTGGTAPITYKWTGPGTFTALSQNISNLAAGTYNVTFTDAAGCSGSASATITEPANGLSASVSNQTNVNCFGTSTGSATIAATGGTSPYTYSLNGVQNTTGLFSGLAAATYSVTVADKNGCTAAVALTITQAPALTVGSINSNSPLCIGTNLTLSSAASGGTAPYTYAWTGPNSFTSTDQNPVLTTVTDAASGVYTLQITDSKGCIASTGNTVNVTVNLLPDASAGDDKPFNFDGNTTLNGSSSTTGATFKWTAPPGGEIKSPADQANVNVGVPGIYTLTVAAAGCVTTKQALVSNKVSKLIGSELTSIYYNNPNGDPSPFFIIANGMVRIDIIVQVNNYDNVLSLLQSSDYGLINTVTNGVNGAQGSKLIITGDYPIANLLKLNLLNDIINFCRPFYAPFSNSGLVNSAGDTTMRSNLVRSGYKLTGAGIKVGVISNSFNTISSGTTATLPYNPVPGAPQTFNTNTAAVDLSNGDLSNVTVLQDYPRSTDEGRAMLQIVHDVAPGASLYFRTGFFTAGDFATGIADLKNAGCSVIVDDVTYITEPYLKDGVVAKAVDAVKAQGVSYFSAAGNFANKSYEQDFTPASAAPAGFPGKMAHDFSGTGDIFQHITLVPGDYTIVLQWVDDIYSTGQIQGTHYDLDMFWTSNTDGTGLKGFNRDNTNGDPLEILPFTITTLTDANFLVVNNTTDGNPARIKYIIYRGDVKILEYNVGTSTLVGQANAAGAIAVGAARYDKAPPYLTTPLTESFSSIGGTKTEGVVRNKPDLVGPDGVNTTVKMGQDYPNSALDGYSNFFGTSAAAPHAAAVAALLMEGKKKFLGLPATPPDDIRSLMQATAVDMETSSNLPGTHFDFISGYGLVNADSAMRTFAAPTATLIDVIVPPAVIPCSGTPFTVTITGENFNYNTIVMLVNAPGDTTRIVPTFISSSAVSVTVSSCVGNPEILAYTPPKSGTNGTDGGFSNSKYFFSSAITVTANNITKKYGETLVAPSAVIKVNGVLLQNTSPLLSLQDIGLDKLVLTTAATTGSDVGTYVITPSRTFDPANTTDLALQKKYSYQFFNGAVTIAKMPLKVTPNNTAVAYGKNIGTITYKYEYNTTNIYNPDSLTNAIKVYHQGLLPTNALAVVKDFKKQQLNGSTLSAADLVNMSMIASFNAVKNSRKFSLSNNALVPIPAGSSLLQDNLNIQYLVDIASESIYNYKLNPATAKFIAAYPGISPKALLGATAMESDDSNIGTVDVNGSLLKVVSGSLEQMVSTSNGLVAPILNGELVQVVDGVTVPASDGLVQYVNDGSWVQITTSGSLLKVVNGLLKLVNGTLIKVVNGVSYVQFTSGSLLKVVNGSLLKVVNGTNTVVYQDGTPVLDSTLVMLPNGLVQAVNGSLLKVVNGSLLKVVNGSLLKVVNGSLLKVVNGSLLKVVSGTQLGTDAANNNIAVILDSADAAGASGAFSPGSMFGVNMITGLDVGKQYLVPGVLADPNFDITYGLGEVDIQQATLTVTANNVTRPYGENNQLTATYSGFVPGDSLQNSVTTLPVLSTTATQTSAIGTYPITVSGGTSSRYTFNYVPGVLTVVNNPCLLPPNTATNFGSTANPNTPTSLWLNLTTKVSGQLAVNGDYLTFRAGTIVLNNINYTLVGSQAIPNGKIIADNSVAAPVTNFDAGTNTWITRVPLGFASTSDIFITGAIINSSTGFAKKNNANTVVTGIMYSNKFFKDQWTYATAAYQLPKPTNYFTYAQVGGAGQVVAINGTYRAGTPLPVIQYLVQGGSGGGGNNYTGSTASFNTFTACIPSDSSAVNRLMTGVSQPVQVAHQEDIALAKAGSLSIFPNPASADFTLVYVPAQTGASSISILTADGKQVMEFNNGVWEAGKKYVKNIDVSRLVRGLYLVQLKTGNNTTVKKIVINR